MENPSLCGAFRDATYHRKIALEPQPRAGRQEQAMDRQCEAVPSVAEAALVHEVESSHSDIERCHLLFISVHLDLARRSVLNWGVPLGHFQPSLPSASQTLAQPSMRSDFLQQRVNPCLPNAGCRFLPRSERKG